MEMKGLTPKWQEGVEDTTAKLDLYLAGTEVGDTMAFTLNYKTKLFKEETIQRFIKYFEMITAAVIDDPEKKLAQIEIISGDRKERIIDEFSDDFEEE